MSTHSNNQAEGAVTLPLTAPEPRLCVACGEPIPAARLLAVPTAARCVPCLEAAGDVPRLRRYDEQVGSLPVQTYYKHASPYLALVMAKLQRAAIPAVEGYEFDDTVAVTSVTHPEPTELTLQQEEYFAKQCAIKKAEADQIRRGVALKQARKAA